MRTYPRAAVPRCVAALAAALVAALAPGRANAQRALVYCPVDVDATGCTTITSALARAGAFPGGVDRGHTGAGGTVDLRKADLTAYAVVVVPSLADDSAGRPYALLRDIAVAARLRAALLGRQAYYSGTPDQGSNAATRRLKDTLLVNLARWAAARRAAAGGPGLVVLQDQSEDVTARYAWVRAVAGHVLRADPAVRTYASLRALGAAGRDILAGETGPLAYANMASFGVFAAGDSSLTVAAVGDAGPNVVTSAVLLTADGAGAGGAASARPGFAFLPPLAADTLPTGAFDAHAAAAVEVCAWTGSVCVGPPVARFTAVPAGAELRLVTDSAGGRYEASLGLDDVRFASLRTYRIRVLHDTTELGALSVDVERGRWRLAQGDAAAPMLAAATLPIRFAIAAGAADSATIGAAGGIVTASGSGATLAVLPGTLTAPTRVQMSDTALGPVNFMPISSASRLRIPLSTLGAAGGIRLEVPLLRKPAPGRRVYVRTRIVGAPQDLWAYATVVDRRASVMVPATGLRELAVTFGLSTVDMLVVAESYSDPDAVTAPNAPASRLVDDDLEYGVACQPLPDWAMADWYSPCNAKVLRPVKGNAPQRGEPGVVLVHGWMKFEATWADYYRDQGIQCTFARNPFSEDPTLIRFLGCSRPAPAASPPELPSEIYFAQLIPALAHDLPRAPLLVYEYETFDRINTNGEELARQIQKYTADGGGRMVVIGHSMGGRVARVAVQSGAAPSVSAVLTLATPHLGSSLATHDEVGGVFIKGILTAGARDLAVAAAPFVGTTQFYLYGGHYAGWFHEEYTPARGLLCYDEIAQQGYADADCDSDGVVLVRSALPETGLPETTVRHPVFEGYHHWAMAFHDGDPRGLYATILTDVCKSLPCLAVSPRAVEVTVPDAAPQNPGGTSGGTPSGGAPAPDVTVKVTLHGVPKSARPAWRSLQGLSRMDPADDGGRVVGVRAWANPGDPKRESVTEGADTFAVGHDTLVARLDVGAGAFVEDTVLVTVREKLAPKEPPTGPPAVQTPGASFGDPHLQTLDGRFYDFMAVGDYVLVRSTARPADLEVHVRYRPVSGFPASVNDAVAIRVAGDVLNILPRANAVDLDINGAKSTATSLDRVLPGGGRLLVSSREVVVSWPDGSAVRLTGAGTALAVRVFLARARAGTVEGLLGDFDGDPDDDLRAPGGPPFDGAPGRLYKEFRDSWRVPLGSPASLFRGGPDYWDASFPQQVVTVRDLPADKLYTAIATCRAAGVAGPDVLEACAFDVALTGDRAFATAAAEVDPARRASVSILPALRYVTLPGPLTWVRLQAVVSGVSDRALTWTSSGGTLQYPCCTEGTAELRVAAPGEYTVTAASVEDPRARATVRIVVAAPPPPGPALSLAVDPVLAAGLLGGDANVYIGSKAPTSPVTITLTSSDPKVLLLGPPDQRVPGAASIRLPYAGASSLAFTMHGVEGPGGTATVTASAPGYADAREAVDVRPALVITDARDVATAHIKPIGATGLGGIGLYIGHWNGDGRFVVRSIRPGGQPVTVTLRSSNPSILQIETRAGVAPTGQATIPVGERWVYGVIGLDPIAAGVADLSVTASPSRVVAAEPPHRIVVLPYVLAVPSAQQAVGAGLQAGPFTITLPGAAPPGGLRLTVASSDPSMLRVAPSATTAGAEVVTLQVPAGATRVDYFLQGVEGRTGRAAVMISGAGAGYADVAAPAEVVPAAVELLGVPNTMTTRTPAAALQARIGVLTAGRTVAAQSVRAGGAPVTVTVASSNAAAAQLATAAGVGRTAQVIIPVGASTSPAGTSTTTVLELRPVGAGATTVSITGTQPSAVGADGATRQVTVTANVTLAPVGVP